MYVVRQDAKDEAARLARRAGRLAERVEGEHDVDRLVRLVREGKRLAWQYLALALEIGTTAERAPRAEKVPER